MTGGTTRDGDAPRAIFSAAARMRRWLPLYVVDIALLLIATVLLIASIFTVYATPTVSLFTSGSVSIAGTVAEVFPNDASAQEFARYTPCQTLLNVGCPLIFPNAATASTTATEIATGWFGSDAVDDGVMLDQASPYDLVSCDWAPSITPGEQITYWQWFPTRILDVQMRSTTLPEMMTVSAQIGCSAYAAPGENITTYRIQNTTLLSLVSDPDGLANGTTVAAPDLADLAREGTKDGSLLHTMTYSFRQPCVNWVNGYDYDTSGCASAPGAYVVYNDSIRRCPSSTPVEDSTATVYVCESVTLENSLSVDKTSTVATTVMMDYRYRASGSDMQLVQLDSPSSTRSSTTGEATAPHSRGGLTRAVGITIVAVVVLGITLVIVVVATVCVACNYKRAKITVTTMQDGFASPRGNPIGRLVGPRGELLRHVADTEDAPDAPLFEYEPPQDERDATLAAEDRPYGQGAYYGPGEKPPAEAEPHKTRETAPALESSNGDHTPYGSANEKMWSAEGEERFVVDGAAVKAISTAPESTPDPDSHGNVSGAAAPSTEEATEHGRRVPGSAVAESAELPNGIPLRMDGNAGLYEQVGFSAVRRYVNHTTRMFLLLVPACVLSTVGVVLSLVILVVQITGALEHWRRVASRYGIASASASLVMHPEGGAIALYVIALIAALAAAIMVWCLLICRIY